MDEEQEDISLIADERSTATYQQILSMRKSRNFNINCHNPKEYKTPLINKLYRFKLSGQKEHSKVPL